MAAFGALIRGDLPPAGNPIHFAENGPDIGAAALSFDNYQSVFVDSGTSALALAMILARELRPHIKAPEAVLPAYGCPDLVAAAEYAGVKPVLVDIGCDDPGYDLSALLAAINENTLLIVAVNFLGIRERMFDIRDLAKQHDLLVVEDSAQWFPEPYPKVHLDADFVLTSFGRGKPVSLLGGGLLLVNRALAITADTIASHLSAAGNSNGLKWKIKLFNKLLNPRCYYWLNRNPLLTLGATVFHPLSQLKALDKLRRQQVFHCVDVYQNQPRLAEVYYDRELGRCFRSARTAKDYGLQRRGRLLRYTLVCENRSQRDHLLYALEREGLGATAMYKTPLAAIPGVAGRVLVSGESHNAREFAGRLLTLPTHSGVGKQHLERIVAIIAAAV